MAAFKARASPAGNADTAAAVHPDTALLLATMRHHHDLIIHRLDQQELLLSGTRTNSPAPSRLDLSPRASPAEASSDFAASSPISPTATLPTREDVFRVTLRSYTEEDTQLRTEADQAGSVTMRKRFSDQTTRQTTQRCKTRLQEERRPWAARIVHHPGFDVFFAFVVMANAIFIGFDIQWVLDGGALDENGQETRTRPVSYMVCHYVFSAFFLAELVLRLMGSRCRYYCSEDWGWAVLDTLIVATSWWDIFVELAEALLQDDRWDSISGLSTLKAMRIVRLTRVLKTAHFLRIFRFIMALRMLVQSILHTVKALFWALLLLGLIIYVFAILFAQAVYDFRVDSTNPALPEEVQIASDRYFGTLIRSMIALFMSIAGGVSWEEVISPLMWVSPFWEGCFLFFIAFSYLAVLNVVTAVFCQSAIESAQSDHATVVQNMLDNKEQHLQKLRALFEKIGDDYVGGITFPMFQEKIDSPAVREYFETLGLDVWDPWAFFKLLDADAGGVVELEEFFLGCLRFGGNATAMEVGQLAADQRWLIRSQGRFQKLVENELCWTRENIASLANAVCAATGGVCSNEL
ncbi:NaCP60E [Symbiodinium necroappetens]|uniref:NaCP60E protein n=1 Tax=Symbiodinium necroappetens TaxID=1628268 RepID=A0A813A247_9DINO|nr:NaCP60E [Symbiodinium necroappetens]